MSIRHLNYDRDYGRGFQAHLGILDVTPYEPEVLILGTFNPATEGNPADFFYGRNYLWTALANLFVYRQMHFTRRRAGYKPMAPSVDEILDLCTRLRLTFADLISEVYAGETEAVFENAIVTLEDRTWDLNKYRDADLEALARRGLIRWNTGNVVRYLDAHPGIRWVYFTRRPVGVWGKHWDQIRGQVCRDIQFTNLYTPSGQGIMWGKVMPELLHRWLFPENPNFGTLDRAWLEQHGVPVEAFRRVKSE